MLWSEMTVFVTSGGGNGGPPTIARRPVVIIAAGYFALSLSWQALATVMLTSRRPMLMLHVDDVAMAMGGTCRCASGLSPEGSAASAGEVRPRSTSEFPGPISANSTTTERAAAR
jgi:hypothetical protein